MSKISSTTSCAYKHFLAYERLAKSDENFAMIVEDDIRFYSNFNIIKDILIEIKTRNIKNFILSLEDSNLKYIPKSVRINGLNIYKKNKGRLAGCYLIDKEGAMNILH